MNRTLTAAVALAAGLGMAGLAQAQQNNENYEHGGKPTASQQAPSAFTSPGTTSPTPNASGAATTPQTMPSSPQANSQGTMPGMQDDQMTQQHQASMRGGSEHTTVAQAQQELKSKGLYNGAIDGIMGPQTKTALSQFQQQNGLRQTAQLDRETRDRLTQGGAGGNTMSQPNPAPANS
jgi:peptidoglycan hydrolase-like protein with peptidoglycan-binding domain